MNRDVENHKNKSNKKQTGSPLSDRNTENASTTIFRLPHIGKQSVREYIKRFPSNSLEAAKAFPRQFASLRLEESVTDNLKKSLDLSDEEIHEFRRFADDRIVASVKYDSCIRPSNQARPASFSLTLEQHQENGAQGDCGYTSIFEQRLALLKIAHRSTKNKGCCVATKKGLRVSTISDTRSDAFYKAKRKSPEKFHSEATAAIKNIANLQSRLESSISYSRTVDKAVKHEILEILKLFRSQQLGRNVVSAKTHAQVKSWGAEKVFKMSHFILTTYICVAMERWKEYIRLQKRKEKKMQYIKHLSVCKLCHIFQYVLLKGQAKCWLTWLYCVQRQRQAERYHLEWNATVAVQTLWRTYVAKALVDQIRTRIRRHAATHIQRISRGIFSREYCKMMLRNIETTRAATVIQCLARSAASRCVLLSYQNEHKKSEMAIIIQKRLRGLFGRNRYRQKRYLKRRYDSCLILVRLFRRRVADVKNEERKKMLRHRKSIILIQSHARMIACKTLAKKLVQEKLFVQQQQNKVALFVQKIFRGRCDRIKIKDRMEEYAMMANQRRHAIISIQSWVRSTLAKRLCDKLKYEMKETMIAEARLWKEIWSTDANTWFYFNSDTDEASWQPPCTGYTKNDSKLVLRNGEVIEDPLNPLLSSIICVDCEDRKASVLCNDCEDFFCTKCYSAAHPKGGKREDHTFTRIGPIDCEECQETFAVRWCTQCEGPFCLLCWKTIHKSGQRASHPYCRINSDGNVSPRTWSPEGSMVGIFPLGYQSEITDQITQTSSETKSSNFNRLQTFDVQDQTFNDEEDINLTDWVEYKDSNEIPYYYNHASGESTYEKPWSAVEGENKDEINNTKYHDTYSLSSDLKEERSGYVGETMSNEWTTYEDENGILYYYNNFSGESTYSNPYGNESRQSGTRYIECKKIDELIPDPGSHVLVSNQNLVQQNYGSEY